MNDQDSGPVEQRTTGWDNVVPPAMPPPGIRTPLNYRTQNSELGALLSRYRYYSRLDPGIDDSLIMPPHVVPINCFALTTIGQSEGPKQSSFVTVFAIWNSMMGTSVLLMPWALNQAGMVLGLILIILMGLITYYTAYRVVESTTKCAALGTNIEFADVCRYYFGRWGDRVALWFSLICLIGATIVNWILMSNFLFFTGSFLYELVSDWNSWTWNTSIRCDAVCSSGNTTDVSALVHISSSFYSVWQLRKSVPLFLVIVIFPLLNFKSPTVFTKFSGVGTISVVYLLIFVFAKMVQCGIHADLSYGNPYDIELFKSTFPSLTGALSLSYFIHNGIVTILKNQKNPDNNSRDLGLGYGLVCCTYMAVALVFFLAFPMSKNCISDNFLNNFGPKDILSAAARVFLLFQMLTIYPLLTFLIRSQLFCATHGKAYPSVFHVIGLNLALITLGILFAIFYPSIGSILRYVGAASGLVYVFALPCLVYLKRLKGKGQLTWWNMALHGGIILFGIVNLLCQFVEYLY